MRLLVFHANKLFKNYVISLSLGTKVGNEGGFFAFWPRHVPNETGMRLINVIGLMTSK